MQLVVVTLMAMEGLLTGVGQWTNHSSPPQRLPAAIFQQPPQLHLGSGAAPDAGPLPTTPIPTAAWRDKAMMMRFKAWPPPMAEGLRRATRS